MKTVVQKQNLGEIVMMTACVVSVLKNIIDSSLLLKPQLYILTRVLLVIFFMCMVYKFFVQKYTFINLVILLVVGAICAYSNFMLKYYYFFYSFIFICGLQNVDINKILKASIVTKVIMLSFHVLAYFILYFMKPGLVVYFYRDGVERQSFFFGHPNVFTAYLAWTCLEIIYVYHDKFKVWHYLLIQLVNMMFYYFTNSNTGTIVVTGVVILSLLRNKNIKVLQKVVSSFSKYGFLAASVFFYIVARIYPLLNAGGRKLWETFDKALTGRLMFGAYTVDLYGITWLGRLLNTPDKSFWRGRWFDIIYFDNSFYEYLFKMGAIFLIIISISLIIYNYKMSYMDNLFMCALIYYGIMESYIVNVFICFPFMLIGKFMFEKNEEGLTKLKEEVVPLWMQY